MPIVPLFVSNDLWAQIGNACSFDKPKSGCLSAEPILVPHRLAIFGIFANHGAYRGKKPISRSRADKPVFAILLCIISVFIRAISTPVGHSRRQALQPIQSFRLSSIASEVMPLRPSCPDSARRRTLALPLVECCSSRVARKEGHIAPPESFLHAPLLLHISTAPLKLPQEDQSNSVGNSSVVYVGLNLRSERSSMDGGLTIRPGFNILDGSNNFFISANASTICEPNIGL